MTTPSIQSKLVTLHDSDGLVDLYRLDASAIGGPILYFSNTCYENSDLLTWGGQAYQLVPIGVDTIEIKADGSQLPRINISIQSAPILPYVSADGDFVGATLYHYRTKVSYLDAGANPSTTEYVGPVIWKIIQKSQHTNQSMTFVGANLLDIPGQQFPIRQILVYPNINPPDGIYFPGVSPYRTGAYQSQ